MSKKGKHHYVPVFYLKQWAAADQQICEYKQRYHGVLPKRVSPGATGYVHGLYSVPGLPKEDEQYVETKFMANRYRVDQEPEEHGPYDVEAAADPAVSRTA